MLNNAAYYFTKLNYLRKWLTKSYHRGKMIGMMYLVLTAMLALNVSKDVVKAFNAG